ncbi:hypothetical protein [Alishewanella longhuensis]
MAASFAGIKSSKFGITSPPIFICNREYFIGLTEHEKRDYALANAALCTALSQRDKRIFLQKKFKYRLITLASNWRNSETVQQFCYVAGARSAGPNYPEIGFAPRQNCARQSPD